ncbi:MAG: hypothetical protein LBR53_05545 [Deltaproteobacteria bacterium]|jgi:hypothetical protein|nr:hypothetical protein [Deltaproteobacteria bacterium]
MTNSDANDDWIHRVRIEIYEKTKNMSTDEFLEYFRRSGEETAKKYGFTIEKPLDEQKS